jgi:hypothetical protein
MMKVIQITDHGYVWHIPLQVIAENRAEFYGDDHDTSRAEEIDYVMNDDHEGLDWFLNNMDFENVANEARLIHSPEPKIEPDMGQSETEIIEVSALGKTE